MERLVKSPGNNYTNAVASTCIDINPCPRLCSGSHVAYFSTFFRVSSTTHISNVKAIEQKGFRPAGGDGFFNATPVLMTAVLVLKFWKFKSRLLRSI
ncbi:hypothetical protein KIN20_025399 [Parelaphostrongylus tenuis]|uniref:Uncharacterized protein n=1 Tax=Parelaphostrongylus tenuis TaxID=148309 RepID=A0AAD5MYE1_PARTN|nr:hypothetical protein KIN20_025399 [Parelaphostrongylus tenuis]